MTTTTGRGPIGAVLSREMQMQLTEAFATGADQALVLEWLARYPELSDEIITFMLALRVVDGPEIEATPEVDPAIERGIARAMTAIAAASAVQAMDLRVALKAAGMPKLNLARELRIGVDVVNKFVQGKIDLATVPQRFFASLGAALQANADQARQWLEQSMLTGAQLSPQLRRGAAQTPAQRQQTTRQSFVDAVRESPAGDMTAADRAAWIEAD